MITWNTIKSWFGPSKRESPPTPMLDDNPDHRPQLVKQLLDGLEVRKLVNATAMIDPAKALHFIHTEMFEAIRDYTFIRCERLKTQLITAKGDKRDDLQTRIDESMTLMSHIITQANIATAKTGAPKNEEEQLTLDYGDAPPEQRQRYGKS